MLLAVFTIVVVKLIKFPKIELKLKFNKNIQQLYRADIDGLRGLAVISVLLHHVGFFAFSGGFVGVDIFFVISGFLITRIIIDEIVHKKNFSLLAFYTRRARRILPALYFTLFISTIFAFILFAPEHYERFSGALIATSLGFSNLYYIGEVSYFGVNSIYKPLLHTWSLGVEEQFYLIWPITLFTILRFSNGLFLAVLMIIFFLTSLTLAWLFQYSASGFYFPLFRFYELIIGASMVWVIRFQPQKAIFLESIFILGLLILFYSIFNFSEEMPFPSIYALLPCIGAALIIYAGTAKHSRIILANRFMVKTGLISYSLYLIHWPIIVFYNYYFYGDVGELKTTLIILSSFFIALLMWRFVEQPFRRQPDGSMRFSNRVFGISFFIFAFLLIVPSINSWSNNGWDWRFKEIDYTSLLKQSGEDIILHEKFTEQTNLTEFSDDPSYLNILVVGDSHSDDIASAIFQNVHQKSKIQVVRLYFDERCFVKNTLTKSLAATLLRSAVKPAKAVCKEYKQKLESSNFFSKADLILSANKWSSDNITALENIIIYLKDMSDAKIILIGQNANFTQSLESRIVRVGLGENLNKLSYKLLQPYTENASKILKDMADNLNIKFLERFSFVCNKLKRSCLMANAEGSLLYRDDNHWSVNGQKYFGSLLVNEMMNREFLRN